MTRGLTEEDMLVLYLVWHSVEDTSNNLFRGKTSGPTHVRRVEPD